MSSRTGKRININDLYFGIVMWDPNLGIFREYNLFDSMRVLRSLAIYKIHPELYTQFSDILFAIYGDTAGRVQYEFDIRDIFGKEEPVKMDVYRMFVEPNRDYLLSLVDSVTVASARKWLKEYKDGR